MAYPKRSKYEYGTKEWLRDRNLKKAYGITLGEWEEKFKEQGSCCAICRSTKCSGHNWHTDHNHRTGAIRSILCGKCNTALGKFDEDYITMTIASIYSLVWNYRDKGGIEDLRKARHYLELLAQFEYDAIL